MIKKSFYLILFALLPITVFSQDNYIYYSKAIPAKGYENKRVRFQAFVRTEGVEEDAAARLWVALENSGGDKKLIGKPEDHPIRTAEWKSFIVEGTIDAGTQNILFGMLLQYNGKFQFDDLEIAVEMKKNKWVSIYKEGFEGATHQFKQGNQPGASKEFPLYTESIVQTSKHSGRQSLEITGRGVPNYGANSTVGKYANVNGIKLYYEIYGSGEPLLVLHGNGGSISNATPHYPELIKRYKVIAVDSRGQGKSTDTNEPLTFEQIASDINSLLDELQTDSLYVWGHSDGAILGLMLAMDYPRKVKRLLAYGANIQPDSTAIFYWAVNGIKKHTAELLDGKEKKLNILMTEHPNIPFERLSKIQVPVLVMAGDRDIITPEHTLKIFQHIPKSQMCILPGGTHNAAWDQQKLFLQLLTDFFEKPFTMPDTKDWFK